MVSQHLLKKLPSSSISPKRFLNKALILATMAQITYHTRFFETAEEQAQAADQARADLGALTHSIYINLVPQVLVVFGLNSEVKDGLIQLPRIHRQGLEPVYADNRFLVLEITDLTQSVNLSLSSQGYWKFKEE